MREEPGAPEAKRPQRVDRLEGEERAAFARRWAGVFNHVEVQPFQVVFP